MPVEKGNAVKSPVPVEVVFGARFWRQRQNPRVGGGGAAQCGRACTTEKDPNCGRNVARRNVASSRLYLRFTTF